MRRRTVLASLPATALTFAGCSTTSHGSRPPPRRVAVSDTRSPPDIPVEPSVSIVSPTAAEGHPPRLRVEWTNTGEETVRIGEAREITFAHDFSDGGRVRLLPRDWTSVTPGTGAEGCARLRPGGPITVTGEFRSGTLDPGDSHARVVGVWVGENADSDGCLPTGEFAFETPVHYGTADGSVLDSDPGETWGFTLSVRTA